jgi:hypothetical protein
MIKTYPCVLPTLSKVITLTFFSFKTISVQKKCSEILNMLLNEILAIMLRDMLPKREALTVNPSDANESLRAYQSGGRTHHSSHCLPSHNRMRWSLLLSCIITMED